MRRIDLNGCDKKLRGGRVRREASQRMIPTLSRTTTWSVYISASHTRIPVLSLRGNSVPMAIIMMAITIRIG